jgi:hypothetical protein
VDATLTAQSMVRHFASYEPRSQPRRTTSPPSARNIKTAISGYS